MDRRICISTVLMFIVLNVSQSWSALTPGLKQKIATLVGDNSQTRLVWAMGANGAKIVGYDSQNDAMHTIVDDARNKRRALLNTGGHRVVYMDDSGTVVVNWDGTGKRRINRHFVGDSWLHPENQNQYAFCQTTTGHYDTGYCIRYNLDQPSDTMVLYRGLFGTIGQSWWQVSLDGKVAYDYLPWGGDSAGPRIIKNGGIGPVAGVYRFHYAGCRSTVERSNDYIMARMYSPHEKFSIYKHDPARVIDSSMKRISDIMLNKSLLPAGTITNEWNDPKFASKGKSIMAISGGYDDSKTKVSVYLLKFSPDYKTFTNEVQVTTGDGPNVSADAWVGVENDKPVIQIELGTIDFLIGKGDPSPAPVINKVKSATPVALKDLSVSSSASWLVVEPQKTSAGWDLKTTANLSGLPYGFHNAIVTVTSSGAFPEKQFYLVRVIVATREPPIKLKITPESVVIGANSKVLLTAAAYDASDNMVIPPPDVTWFTTHTSITVSQTGLVTSKTKPGSYTVKASSGSLSATATIILDTTTLPPDSISLDAPRLGGAYRVGDTLIIQWRAGTAVAGVVCEASFDNGKSWIKVNEENAIDPANSHWGRFPWVIPPEIDDGGTMISCISDVVYIRVVDYNDPTNKNTSTAPISIGEGTRVIANNSIAQFRSGTIAIQGNFLVVRSGGQPCLVTLTNTAGKIVCRRVLGRQNVHNVNISTFATGIYVVYLDSPLGRISAPLQVVR